MRRCNTLAAPPEGSVSAFTGMNIKSLFYKKLVFIFYKAHLNIWSRFITHNAPYISFNTENPAA